MQLEKNRRQLISMVKKTLSEIQSQIHRSRLEISELQKLYETLKGMKGQIPLSSQDIKNETFVTQKGRKPGSKNKKVAKVKPVRKPNIRTIKKEEKPDDSEIEPPKREMNERELEIKRIVFQHEGRFDKDGHLTYQEHPKGIYSNRRQSKYLDEVDNDLKNNQNNQL